MEKIGPYISRHGLERQGIDRARRVYWNLPAARLYEESLHRGESSLAADGPLVALTGEYTGRSPNDRFVVRETESAESVWWGKVNRAVEDSVFRELGQRVREHFADRDLFVFDGYVGADERYRMPVRVVTELAWHNLFARNMFVRPATGDELEGFEPSFTVLSAPSLEAGIEVDGTAHGTAILLHLAQKEVLIAGTAYAGEIKKSIFTSMNYLLPRRAVLPMHCSANYAPAGGRVALFFGLSGTGKTTLSSDPERVLIGDDEHGWSEDGVFNMEGGCYAKVIRLDPEGEPDIFATTRSFGTILENVVVDPETRALDLDDDTITENTRASYPLTQLRNADQSGVTGHPEHVIFLTCDAFGVLPPISRLTEPQALYHFLSGYTAKVAGTERGVTEPTATFSTCFGAPFMPLHPGVYAEMLGERLRRHGSRVWMVNTGWAGGGHGVGSRMRLRYTRRMVAAALNGELDDVGTSTDPTFQVAVPDRIEGVPSELLRPRETWGDGAAYSAAAARLAEMFSRNFEQFADGVSAEVVAAGPVAAR